jgi:hypothetical protein
VLTTPYVLLIPNSSHIRVIDLTSALVAVEYSVCLSVCQCYCPPTPPYRHLGSDGGHGCPDRSLGRSVSALSQRLYIVSVFSKASESTTIPEIFGSSGPDIQVRARDSPTSQLRKWLSASLSLTYTYCHSTPGLSSRCAELKSSDAMICWSDSLALSVE